MTISYIYRKESLHIMTNLYKNIMPDISFHLSSKLTEELIRISEKYNCTVDETIEEAILEYYKISLVDLNREGVLTDENQLIQHKYYVYVYLNPLICGPFKYGDFVFDYQPFYVGKGCLNRSEVHNENSHNDFVNKIINDISLQGKTPIVIRIKENLNPLQSYKLENQLITVIGRLDRKQGPLANLSGGIHLEEIDIEDIESPLEDVKVQLILRAINTSKTLKHAADKLSISERTLYRKMKMYNIIKINHQYRIMMS